MVFSSLGLSFFGRPPLRPRARAALRPASVRSRIKLRSNSAKAAEHVKYQLARRGEGIDLLGQRLESDAATL